MISLFKVDASINCGKTFAGRKLANKPISFLIFNNPDSGRNSRGLLSHLYPPIQANNTESLDKHCCKLSSGNGSLTASIAAPPINASFNSKVKPDFSHNAVNATLVAAVISGPIPSPGNNVIE